MHKVLGTTSKFLRLLPIPEYVYCIVLGNHPWALAAQVPKIKGGRLHGQRA